MSTSLNTPTHTISTILEDTVSMSKFVPAPSDWLRLSPEQTEMLKKEHHVAEAEGMCLSGGLRIQVLEAELEKMRTRFAELFAQAENTKTELVEARVTNQKQLLSIQQLLSEADEKDRCIVQLELDLYKSKTRTEASGSPQAPISQTQLHSRTKSTSKQNTIPQAFEVLIEDSGEVAKAPSNPSESATVGRLSASKSIVASPGTGQSENATPYNDESASSAYEVNVSMASKKGPAFNDNEFPLMWTPPAPDAPPVKPAAKPKVLKMAIDMSKYGKKPQSNESLMRKDGKDSSNRKAQQESSTVASGAMAKINPDCDVRKMTFQDRVLFGNGPRVDVMLGKVKLATLSRSILVQCSSKAFDHFKQHPDTSSITFPDGSMDAEAATAHLRWMHEMTYQHRVYSLHMHKDDPGEKNLKICQAARNLGVNNMYVGHFTKGLCDKIRSGTAPLALIVMVCKFAVLENDPVFECLANCLASQAHKVGVTPADVEDLQKTYDFLREKMVKFKQGKKHA